MWMWVESIGVVVRRYIDFLILLIPTPLVYTYTVCSFFATASLLFVHFKNVFCSCIIESVDYITTSN